MIRTFFWHPEVRPAHRLFINRHIFRRNYYDFRFGNAGDIFALNLLRLFYPGNKIINALTAPRLLCVGSIADYARPGDILCGIGSKSTCISNKVTGLAEIIGLRGPLTYDAFKKAGHNVSTVRFLADPGLLIERLVAAEPACPGKVIFIPHYRDRKSAFKRTPKPIDVVDIDSDPIELGKEIMKAELIYTSSLHGLIFSHALRRPCVIVIPEREKYFKYEDYLLSVGIKNQKKIHSIAEANFMGTPVSPAEISISTDDLITAFPQATYLVEAKIVV